MRKVVPIAVALVVAVLAGRAVYRSMASEETRIRWLVQEEVEAFNSASISGCMAGFAMEYEDTTLRLDRTTMQGVLLHTFRKRRDPESGEFLYSIQIPDESVEVTLVGDDQIQAEVVFPVVLSEAGVPVWELAVHGELRRDESGWAFVSSWHETVVGARPGG
jgi:hypothetical protein